MPKTLLAIVNARSRKDWRDVIRKTWLPQVPEGLDAFFFVGEGEAISDLGNVVELKCSDAYDALPAKVQAITKWALARGYEYMLKIDDDVVLRPQAFLDSGYETRDFSGCINRPGVHPVTFGFCYILGQRSMKVISMSPLPLDFDDERWVAFSLYNKGIQLTNVDGYSLHQRLTDDPTVKIARCVHLAGTPTQQQKLSEFMRIFNSPPWSGELRTLESTLSPRTATYRYDQSGLVTNWWDRHR